MGEGRNFGSILITPGCSNNCVFCKIKAYPDKKDLTKEDEKQLLIDSMFFIKKGYKTIDISGSEPLRYSKIIPYFKWITQFFKEVNLLDPCNRLVDEEFCKEVLSCGISRILLPIYGSKPEIHNACVGNPEAFDNITKALSNIKKYNKNVKIEITTMILKQNYFDIAELARFIDKAGFHLDKITIPHCHADNKAINYDEFVADFDKVRNALLSVDKELSNIFLDHIPACILKPEEIQNMQYSFFNEYYLYKLSEKNKETPKVEEIVKDYRGQHQTKYCKECYLFKEGICGGIYKGHYERNLNYHFHPFTKEGYLKNKEKIVFLKVNK
ncbi:MAG: hypothetical protein PWQ87_508 [Candidatus Woesearchaeota archaeon]|nr:hypothetical protein [Candidatus Woesearchaeota archaeon]